MHNPTQEPPKTPEGLADLPQSKAYQRVKTALDSLAADIDLTGSARYSGAMRRKRILRDPHNLLRMVLLYGLSDLSLRMVGLWATVMEWGSLSKNAVRKRLIHCQAWIGILIVSVLRLGQLLVPNPGKYHLRLIDVTNLSQPGSHKIDWRLHLSFSPNGLGISAVQLTDGKQGESLTRWQFSAQDLVLADRIYAVPRGLGVLLGAGASFVIRVAWRNLPMSDRDGQPFSIPDWLKLQSIDPAAAPAETQVWVQTPQGRFPVRLIARALPPQNAAEKRRKLRAESKHKHTRLDERSLLAAGFVVLVSNLSTLEWRSQDILTLYRFRWQIELVFKRLKSILGFEELRAKDPQLGANLPADQNPDCRAGWAE